MQGFNPKPVVETDEFGMDIKNKKGFVYRNRSICGTGKALSNYKLEQIKTGKKHLKDIITEEEELK